MKRRPSLRLCIICGAPNPPRRRTCSLVCQKLAERAGAKYGARVSQPSAYFWRGTAEDME